MSRNKKNPLISIVMLVCVVVMAVSGYKIFTILSVYQESKAEYEDMNKKYLSVASDNSPNDQEGSGDLEGEAGTLEDLTIDNQIPERKTINWEALQADCPNVIAWLEVPALGISYPVMQTDNNEYYLSHSSIGTSLSAGAIFIDYRNDASLDNNNTILYGHNMKNGTMFGSLKNLKKQEVLESSPYFQIYLPDQERVYQIISVYDTAADGDCYTLQFDSQEEYQAWFQRQLSRSVVTTMNFEQREHVVTLSTCNGNDATRLVVQGIFKESR